MMLFILSSYTKQLWLLLVSGALIGFNMCGQCLMSMPIEIFDKRHKSYVPPFVECFWVSGAFWYLLMAYLTRDWKQAMVGSFFPALVSSFIYYHLIPGRVQ